VDEFHVKAMAFDANDFKPEVIEIAKQGHALPTGFPAGRAA
jgi:hypothetical protein